LGDRDGGTRWFEVSALNTPVFYLTMDPIDFSWDMVNNGDDYGATDLI